TSSGNALSIAANRLSYFFDLKGPSLAVDTACSSSLVAVHLACQSLRTKECNIALVGGVNLLITPYWTISTSKWGVMAADGRCKPFDARADGFVRGEGCGVIILKRLSDAIADNDSILALIRGSAINQDGRSTGLTVPNGLSQQAVIKQALNMATCLPSQISYIETHGTGTALGDPIEIEALTIALDQSSKERQLCALGAVKSNIGHLEAAAGIAGLIKVVLALRYSAIPPNLHFQQLNPHISLKNTSFIIPTELIAWPAENQQRFAGVSSFGFGGVNAHVVLAEAPISSSQQVQHTIENRRELLPLSARSQTALRNLAETYLERLSNEEIKAPLSDICYSASLRRTHHEHRLALVVHSRKELVEHLERFLKGEDQVGYYSSSKLPNRHNGLVFVFSGQGSQWIGMGRELLRQQPVFRRTIEECDAALRHYTDWSILTVLEAEQNILDLQETAIAQPVIFALQVALTALWRSWGVTPDAVVGHSLGEIAATYVAGVLSLADAIKIVYHRGRLMQRVSGKGSMAAVELTPTAASHALVGYENRLSIAAINSPTSIVLSGESVALTKVLQFLKQGGISNRSLGVNYAFHSPQMIPLRAEFEEALLGITPQTAAITICSTVTGLISNGESFDAHYWGRNLTDTVRFAEAMDRLIANGYDIYLEIGPHPVLVKPISECLSNREHEALVLSSLRRDKEDSAIMFDSLGTLYTFGYPVDWHSLYHQHSRFVSLPSYPWQYTRYWIENELLDTNSTDQQNIDSWLYELNWKPQPHAKKLLTIDYWEDPSSRLWLIFADRKGIGEALANQLIAQGEKCLLIFQGNTFESINEGKYRICPDKPADLRQLFNQSVNLDNMNLRYIVHLWNLDAPTSQEITASSLMTAQQSGSVSVLHLLQELTNLSKHQSLRLWLVTEGAQPIDEQSKPIAVAQSTIWGLGRTIAQEHSNQWGGLIDLDPTSSIAESAAMLLAEIVNSDGEDNLAIRGKQRYVARLVHKPKLPDQTTTIQWHINGSYLITGGLGALGLTIARWMVAQGARRLILLGRTIPPARIEWDTVVPGTVLAQQIKTIRELEAMGASIHLASVDVADESQLRSFLQTYHREGWPPIRGVVHAAGVILNKPLVETDAAELIAILRAKVIGSWLLHSLLSNEPLDFFILFSSMSALLSSPLLGSYAAGNAFLDALAHHRKSAGYPALSINWGAWGETGMATRYRTSEVEQSLPLNMAMLTSQQGLNILAKLVHQPLTQVGVIPIEIDQWRQFFPALSKSLLLSELLAESDSHKSKERVVQDLLSREILLATDPIERQLRLEEFICQQVSVVIGIPTTKLTMEQPLSTFGIDSLMAFELKNRMELSLKTALPMSHFLRGESIKTLTTLLLDHLVDKENPQLKQQPVTEVSTNGNWEILKI
ncbi:MAG: type I polyketide synthase, partial [Acidobacteriota bacterium]